VSREAQIAAVNRAGQMNSACLDPSRRGASAGSGAVAVGAEAPHVALEIAGELPRAVLLVAEPITISAPAETARSCSAWGVIDRGVDGTRPGVNRGRPYPEVPPMPIVRIAGDWPIGAVTLQT
jgi:hypothetical protein